MASPPLVTVTGMVYEVDGSTPFNGVIEFVQPVTLRHNDGTAILAGTLTATVVDGVLSRQIYVCDAEGWAPQGWTWELRIRAGSTWRTYTLLASVDDTDTVNLGDIIASDAEPTGGLEYAPINHTHTDLGGGGGGAVFSVNGKVGAVVLSAADVGAITAAALTPYATTTAVSNALVPYATVVAVNNALSGYATVTALTDGLAGKSNTGHTHLAANVTDATTVGRAVMTAVDAAAARTAVGAGTSSLALGTTGTTAAAGNHTHPATGISDSTTVGRSLMTAADATAARTAIGAGTLSAVPNPIPLTALASLPAAPAAGVGQLYTRDLNGGALLGYMGSSGVEYSVLRDVVFQVRNASGVTIPKGAPVYITGYSSGGENAIEVAMARANSATTMPVLGLTTTAIANNAFGGCMRFGRLDLVDTSTWAVRDLLYASAATAGGLVNVQPETTATSQRVASVARVHATQGVLWVDVQTMLHNSAGSNRNTWTIGDGTAGAKSYRLVNAAGTSALSANPTAARTWTLPDASVGVASAPMVWNGSAFVEAPLGRVYVGGTVAPVGAPDGSVHIKEV